MGPRRSSKFSRRHRSTFGGAFRHPTSSDVWRLHPVKSGQPALPECAALPHGRVESTNNARPPSGSSINVFHKPNRGNSRREAVLSEAPVHLQLSHPNRCRASSRIAVESGFISRLSIGHTSSKDIVPVDPKYSAAWMRASCTPGNSSAATPPVERRTLPAGAGIGIALGPRRAWLADVVSGTTVTDFQPGFPAIHCRPMTAT